MARLSPDEVAAARSDPRFRARAQLRPKNHPKTTSELLVDRLLAEAGAIHHYEDSFFPTNFSNGVEHGFCPDFRIEAGPDWCEQWWEVTERKPRFLTEKHRKVADAEAIYDIRIVLVDLYFLDFLRDDPGTVFMLLREPAAVIMELRKERIQLLLRKPAADAA